MENFIYVTLLLSLTLHYYDSHTVYHTLLITKHYQNIICLLLLPIAFILWFVDFKQKISAFHPDTLKGEKSRCQTLYVKHYMSNIMCQTLCVKHYTL